MITNHMFQRIAFDGYCMEVKSSVDATVLVRTLGQLQAGGVVRIEERGCGDGSHLVVHVAKTDATHSFVVWDWPCHNTIAVDPTRPVGMDDIVDFAMSEPASLWTVVAADEVVAICLGEGAAVELARKRAQENGSYCVYAESYLDKDV